MENSGIITFLQLVQITAILLTGLLAGLFYGYDCSVIKGLGHLENSAYLQAFQSINKAIQNPYFFLSFMGSLLILPVASWLSYKQGAPFYLLLSASILYFIGVFGVTIGCNIPLNEQLATFQISSATESEISVMRKTFEHSWNTYHKIRTAAAIAVFGLTILALLKQSLMLKSS